MAAGQNTEQFDKQVRSSIYSYFVDVGQAPTVAHIAQVLSTSVPEIRAAFQRLAGGRALVLQSDGEILMAEPFSAVPTSFYVEVGEQARAWWGNCIWDALGIPALLKEDARIVTACGCCNDAMTVEIRSGALVNASGVVHFAIPPKDWWQNVVFA